MNIYSCKKLTKVVGFNAGRYSSQISNSRYNSRSHMCYAIPGKVIALNDKSVTVTYFGEEKRAHNELEDLRIGDYVYAQGGYVISKISPAEAEEILATWKETFFELQEVDFRLSQLDLGQSGVNRKAVQILDRVLNGLSVKREELQYFLECEKPGTCELLFKTANFLRAKHLKNSCCVHGILEISNLCDESCSYCGISKHNLALPRYQMTPDEIVSAAFDAIDKYGFKAIVLQSGENSGYSIDELAYVIRTIKDRSPALIFISFGEVGIEGLQKLFDVGARGLLMRFETSNPTLYTKLHPGSDLETRLDHIRRAYEMGYLIITGGLIGLPGQTKEDIVNDIFLTRDLHAEMYSFGPFLPHPETPLKNTQSVSDTDVLKVIACARLLDPREARILITTAFETLSCDAREKGLVAGGNSVMLNVTPEAYRKKYAIYPHRAHEEEQVQHQIDTTLALLRSLGRAPTDLGASIS